MNSCAFNSESNKEEARKKEIISDVGVSNNGPKTTGEIHRLDEKINQIIPPKAKIEVLAEGFVWAEGPVWVSDGDYLIFSDVPQNKIFKWDESTGLSVYLENSGYSGNDDYSNEPGSNGLMINKEGQLILCQHGNRQLALMKADLSDPAPEYKTLADNYMGKKLTTPNDMDINKDGSIYFTDPPYGLPGRADSKIRELDFFGVYRVSPNGELILLLDQLSRPNGIAFNHDFSKCYINISDRQNPVTMSYDVHPQSGMLENDKVLFDASHLLPDLKGLPDGLKVHPENGIIFSTGPGGVLILTPEGEHLGTIKTGYATANCCFDDKLQYLYMTADNYLMRVKIID